MRLDAVIFGGGVAGLWLLDRLSRCGNQVVLLESQALGTGQTIASQGIIHGGLKYTLNGLLSKSAHAIREMPQIWRDCLLGARAPNLTKTQLRAVCCYLWQTESIKSRLGMIGARVGLQVRPEVIPANDRPLPLRNISGTVCRLPEQVISPYSLISDLFHQYHDRILQIDPRHGLEFHLRTPGEVEEIHLRTGSRTLSLRPNQVIFTAGSGNAELRKLVGLDSAVMQRRPLHMLLVRGPRLPEMNGHCIDGAKTRVTITCDTDSQGRCVWQIGGQIAEDGTKLNPGELIALGQRELVAVLPGLDLRDTEWATYRIDRAEGSTPQQTRPETIQVLCAGNVTTGWPTKLALAPLLADEIASRVSEPLGPYANFDVAAIRDWPRPKVALPPWEEVRSWEIFPPTPQETRKAA